MYQLDEATRQGARNRFRQAREEFGLSVGETAKVMGVSRATVNRWQSPKDAAAPNFGQIMAFCHHTDTAPTWLMVGVGLQHLSQVDGAQRVFDLDKRAEQTTVRIERIEKALAKAERRLKKLNRRISEALKQITAHK